jgi:hypothetical protein
MATISRKDYEEFHETKEELAESYPDEFPKIRGRRRKLDLNAVYERCEACGIRTDTRVLRDGLCPGCARGMDHLKAICK